MALGGIDKKINKNHTHSTNCPTTQGQPLLVSVCRLVCTYIRGNKITSPVIPCNPFQSEVLGYGALHCWPVSDLIHFKNVICSLSLKLGESGAEPFALSTLFSSTEHSSKFSSCLRSSVLSVITTFQ